MNSRYRAKQLILLLGDILCLFLGVLAGMSLRNLRLPSVHELETTLPLFAILIGIWVVINYINGLYELARHKHRSVLFSRMLQASVVNIIMGVMFFYLLPQKIISPKTVLLLSIMAGYSFVAIWRIIFSSLVATKTLISPVLFIGDMEEMTELADLIYDMPERGYALAAWIAGPKDIDKSKYPNTTFYESLKAIRPSVSVHTIDTVVVAHNIKNDTSIVQELYELLFWQTHILSLASLYESITGRIPPYIFSEHWFLDHLQQSVHPVYGRVRRMFDVVLGLLMLLCFFILYPAIALAIRIESKGPVIFRQERVGMSATTFQLFKFRSMYALAPDGSAETEGVQFATKNDSRVTHVGRFLRKSRIDELPQAINLIRGDISIIGPRPERPEIVSQLESRMPYYQVRHLVKPGITGWAQVNQHYTDTLEQSLQKLQYDLYYIKNRSILLDLSILLKTVNVVMRGMGQ
ncbi:MAG: hypothetical protein CO029_00670 [Candidatus Magasanikbacteria bacterium CG_4_9_14_0_2_um_filter_41_10]|uniref:Bacterial sugar transferase domain-containing protein n=1 Tax=Candidatus Magasanikbacteria bacterium CG_4_10_14_0_2_um_filter_41_31 TaxID=1974639 RepID=A0A2M7V4H6_9BACT|nr:MAG: hypothetical protein AUJ37_01375 [Candidatus Magasanikbacteria bacterium CG1_02_41_34]PIZ93446.1 MAG: hypothetical protein COX83_01855 [Candidatus Magasanikbacteria bacterium CG_4_10_14_0_2_um_filter_41_31]PJC53816.1 MAG: hypothetical protein CO029_00670 [Candidatus Magasanikbacteria bacterium CG_4_9_14_0_2_um_filter_41_10]